jgi:hypothetical protein
MIGGPVSRDSISAVASYSRQFGLRRDNSALDPRATHGDAIGANADTDL